MSAAKAYTWIKVGGLLALIPLVLAAGPLTGYIAGDWLVMTFKLPGFVTVVAVILGFVAAAQETIRIIRAALRETGAR